jgi:hypothetical protein
LAPNIHQVDNRTYQVRVPEQALIAPNHQPSARIVVRRPDDDKGFCAQNLGAGARRCTGKIRMVG